MHAAEGSDQWRALVNAVMNFGFQNAGNFLTSLADISFPITTYSVGLVNLVI